MRERTYLGNRDSESITEEDLDYYKNVLEKFLDKHIFPHFVEECNKRGRTFSKDEGRYFILFKKKKPVMVLVDSDEIDRYYKQDRSGLKCSENFPDGEKSPCGYFIEGALPGYSYLYISFSENGTGYDWDLKEFLRSVPKVEQPPIKVSVALEKQKIRPPNSIMRQLTFDDLRKSRDVGPAINEHAIEVIGLDLDSGMHSIVTALQTLLSGELRKGVPSKGKFHLVIEVTKAQFLDACGVCKFESGRGKMEYSRSESDAAMKNLLALRDRRFVLLYWGERNGQKKPEIVRTVQSLISLSEHYDGNAISQAEMNELRRTDSPIPPGPLEKLSIGLNPIFTMDINNQFILKPANYLQEIELASGAKRPSRYEINFIDYLFLRYRDIARKRDTRVIKLGYRALAETIRMNGFIKKQQWKRIRDKLRACCELAKKLNYLTDYSIDVDSVNDYEEKVTLCLNIDKLGQYDEKGRQRVREAPVFS